MAAGWSPAGSKSETTRKVPARGLIEVLATKEQPTRRL
jgi:hypothetical protein